MDFTIFDRPVNQKLKMAPKTAEQFEAIRESRKKQIMDTALKLFSENGFANTSISTIAKHAEISKGLLYNYFDSKEDLLVQLFDNGMEEMLTLFDRNHDGILTQDEFVYFINELFDLMKRKVLFYKLYFSVMMQPSVITLIEKRMLEIFGPFLAMLTAYYKNKGVKNPEAEALMIGALLDGVGFHYVMGPELYPLDEVKQRIINQFI
jgi:AcrR family transcriptional regulator